MLQDFTLEPGPGGSQIEGMDIYGIKNCDTCRKARKWLDESGREYSWHDLREAPPGETVLRRWVEVIGLECLVNRRSTTWRTLVEPDRARAGDPGLAPGLLADNPTLIKRPVFDTGDRILVGFDDTVKQAL